MMEGTEQDWAERFTHDVDTFLDEAGRADSAATPTEYRQALDMAHVLTIADFSVESQGRQALRRRLMDQIGAGKQRRKASPVWLRFWRRRRILILAAAVVTALLVVMLAWPGALAAAAQGIVEFVQSLWAGEHTSIHQIDPEDEAWHEQVPPTTPIVEQREDLWIIRTAIGNFGGEIPHGRSAAVRRFDTLEEMQAAIPFGLVMPTCLPDEYAFREAMVSPSDWAFLFYDGPRGDVILVQMPVGTQQESKTDRGGTTALITTTVVGMITDKPIEQMTLNGRPAVWIEGYGLMWETGGVSYVVGGVNLGSDEAMCIAELLE